MSVSSVYEHPNWSPAHTVLVRYPDHVARHSFYTREDAEAFRLGALEGPDRVEAAVEKANAALDDGVWYPCVLALADLTAAVEAKLRVKGRA